MNERRKPYPFDQIEPKWQTIWDESRSFHAPGPGEENFDPAKPKFYVLDMFPYPSGAGLHVGHPEGYTATDIIARYKRLCGFNVLHPMGWDAFGLPAEQYAIKTGQHPAVTTRDNIAKFKSQLKRIGFSYDWEREVNTTDPGYYKWTQWIFLQIYHSWFNPGTRKAEPISTLLQEMMTWLGYDQWSADVRRKLVNDRRLAYVEDVDVWWCPGLGTVLANEEVIDGKSEVGDYPVERRPMRQWMLRITKYAQHLIDDLQQLDWPESIKSLQRNWIGRSEGAMIEFVIETADPRGGILEYGINVFTTRPDTLYGVTYLVVAPEHPFLEFLTSEENRGTVQAYRRAAVAKSNLVRTELSKDKSGVFTGSYATNPINGEKVPVWVADYVIIKYGAEVDTSTEVIPPNTSRRGAVMGVPAHDERDFEFARTHQLPMRSVVAEYVGHQRANIHSAITAKDFSGYAPPPIGEQAFVHQGVFTGAGVAINSPLIDGLRTEEAKEKIISLLEHDGRGRRHVNYKLSDWLFSRQRYWGEPFPVIWRDGRHEALSESELPLEPPALEDFKPSGTGEPPLAKAKDWIRYSENATRETNTMPQWAGSCWYYLRFCDPQNDQRFVAKSAERYWSFGAEVVDMPELLGGQEFYDQAKILFINEKDKVKPGAVDLYIGGVEHAVLHLLYARFWHKVLFDLGHVSKPEPFQRLVNQGMILGEDGRKMSKRWGNVIDPLDVIEIYGADSFRCYEMFMGPLEQMKPWSMKGVEGVSRFLARVWRLMMEENQAGEWALSIEVEDVDPDKAQLKILHATIKKVTGDIETLSFNTAISQMMILVNALTNSPKKSVSAFRTLLILLNPFAPHLTSELWQTLAEKFPGTYGDITKLSWPQYDESLLVEDEIEIILQVNGKLRDKITVGLDATNAEIEAAAVANKKVLSAVAGQAIRKVVVVPKKLVNVVTG